MIKLIFSDGKEKEVKYNDGARVYQILQGNMEPKDKAEEDYCLSIKEVVFPESTAKITKIKGDPKVKEIISRKDIYGYKKFKTLKEYLKTR